MIVERKYNFIDHQSVPFAIENVVFGDRNATLFKKLRSGSLSTVQICYYKLKRFTTDLYIFQMFLILVYSFDL